MTKRLKTYDVIVTTSAEWFGTVEAKSRSAAKRLAEDEFNEGNLKQCDEEIQRIKIQEVRR